MSIRKRHLFAACLILFLAALAIACAPRATAADPAADRAALIRLSDHWDQAIVRKDAAAISANMAEDFRQIRSNGDLVDKAVFLRDITSSDLTIDPYQVEELEVRLLGDTALLTGHTHMKGSYGGAAFATHYRYIDVYARRDGKWQVVSVQITTIPAPAG
jgi:ketosteroid isomerase-like protein